MPTQEEILADFPRAVFQASSASEDSPWQSYNLAPKARTVRADSIYATEGDVSASPQTKVADLASLTLTGSRALVTLDFGVNTAGIVTLEFGPQSIPQTALGIAFSESKQFISRGSDRSMDFHVTDGALHISVPKSLQSWTCPKPQQRGAFRYLTLFLESDGKVEVTGISTYNNMNPSLGNNLRNYPGYFYSSDDFFNTIWYAGAYTIQLATIPRDTGRRSDWVHKKTGWCNDSPAAAEKYQEVLTDGARRDRTVWSGDRNVSTVTNFIALNGKESAWAGVDWMFELQTADGLFPYACKPIWHYGSDSYHGMFSTCLLRVENNGLESEVADITNIPVWTFIAMYEAYFYHSDGSEDSKEWIREKWGKVKKAMRYALSKVDETGLLKVTLPADWGRHPLKGHNLEVNCCLHYSLRQLAQLARDVMGDETLSKSWAEEATLVKEVSTLAI